MSLSNNYPTTKPSLLLDFANTKQLDPRITFTRTSTATYYDGVTTAKAEENLLTYSQEFDNAAWQKLNTTVTANSITAPDGTITADTLSAAGTNLNAFVRLYSTVLTIGSVTTSIYAKAGTKTVLQFGANAALTGSNDARANFDISTGALGTVDAALTASIVSVGNNWYRCTVSWTRSGTASANGVWSMQDSTTAAREATSTAGDIYIWGAQLEQRSSVTAYTATTTQPVTNYIPVLLTAASGVPRFNHNPTTGESLGLLIEESRTNLLTYSSEFDNAAWTKTEATITANTVVAPDGLTSADKFIPSTNAASHWLNNAVSSTTAQCTGTVYVKLDGSVVNKVTMYPGGGGTFGQFNLGALTSFGEANVVSTSIQNVGNGWYRLQTTWVAGITVDRFRIYVSSGTVGDAAIAGNGFSGVFLWGAQLEAGGFSTSYVPTIAATVTRSADSAIMTGTNFSSWFNKGEGTIYIDCAPGTYLANSAGYWQIDSGVTFPYIKVMYSNVNVFGTTYPPTIAASGSSVSGPNKLAHAFSSAGSASSINSSTVATTTTATSFDSATTFRIGFAVSSPQPAAPIKKIAFYPARLTNAQLQALTV